MSIAYIKEPEAITARDISEIPRPARSIIPKWSFNTSLQLTGDYYVTEVYSERNVVDEINKFMPSEIICNHAFLMCGMDIDDIKNKIAQSIKNNTVIMFLFCI